MDPSFPYSLPVAPIIFLLFLVFLFFLFFVLPIKLVNRAFEKTGIPRRYGFLVLLACLLGSGIDIPIAHIGGGPSIELIQYYPGGRGHPWSGRPGSTLIALNVGGGLIPLLVCGYLIVKRGWNTRILWAVVLVSGVIHYLAEPVPGRGISVPFFLPAIAAALTAYLLARKDAPRTAYIAGTLGTLIGADLLNLGVIGTIGAPIASIGGAGTFDAIFLTGIVAALLA